MKRSDKSCVTVAADIPTEWGNVLKEEAKNRVPRISRKALLYLIISKAVRRIEAKGK